jgi:hypothetical protein
LVLLPLISKLFFCTLLAPVYRSEIKLIVINCEIN